MPCFLSSGSRHKWAILVGILSAVTLLSLSTFILLLFRRKVAEESVEVPKAVSKTLSANKSFSRHNQLIHKQYMEGQIKLQPILTGKY